MMDKLPVEGFVRTGWKFQVLEIGLPGALTFEIR